jgi:putative nucleotidyltransferase with HDIG domain
MPSSNQHASMTDRGGAERQLRAAAPLHTDDDVARLQAASTLSVDRVRAAALAVLRAAREHLDMDVSYISRITDEEQIVASVDGDGASFGIEPGTTVPLAQTYCQQVLDGRLGSVVPDAAVDSVVRDMACTSAARIGAYVGVPVRFSDGTLFGTLCCVSHEPAPWLRDRDESFMRVLAQLLADQLEREELERRVERYRVEADALSALLAALDARDSYTSAHSEAVVELAGEVAEELGLPDADVAEIKQVAMLHDIGKIGIPDAVLGKPGRLDDEEWELMRTHPQIGADIVSSIDSLSHLAPAVRAEHERCDGTGYPDGLRRDEIPLASRIALACDAFHAMTSTRPYRGRMRREDAIRELVRNAGTQFDPDVVAALTRVLGEP